MPVKSFDGIRSDEALQFLADRASGRNHPKRHRTKPRRRRLSEAKKTRIRNVLAAKKVARSKYLTASKAYWAGDVDEHP